MSNENLYGEMGSLLRELKVVSDGLRSLLADLRSLLSERENPFNILKVGDELSDTKKLREMAEAARAKYVENVEEKAGSSTKEEKLDTCSTKVQNLRRDPFNSSNTPPALSPPLSFSVDTGIDLLEILDWLYSLRRYMSCQALKALMDVLRQGGVLDDRSWNLIHKLLSFMERVEKEGGDQSAAYAVLLKGLSIARILELRSKLQAP